MIIAAWFLIYSVYRLFFSYLGRENRWLLFKYRMAGLAVGVSLNILASMWVGGFLPSLIVAFIALIVPYLFAQSAAFRVLADRGIKGLNGPRWPTV